MTNLANMEKSVSEAWNHKVKYVKFHEGQKVYYFRTVENVGHRKIRNRYQEAVIVKIFPADV